MKEGKPSLLALPGLSLLVLVPFDDLATIEVRQKIRKTVGPRRRGPQVTMTLKELAQ